MKKEGIRKKVLQDYLEEDSWLAKEISYDEFVGATTPSHDFDEQLSEAYQEYRQVVETLKE